MDSNAFNVDGWFALQAHPALHAANVPYRGQLDPAFQEALAARYADIRDEDCHFSQVVEIDGRVAGEGPDVRQHESAWLGGEAAAPLITGTRVLEYAPRAGAISDHLSRIARELVVIDEAPARHTPILAAGSENPAGLQLLADGLAARIRNGWWRLRQSRGFAAQVVYGAIEDPPPDLGHFDVAILADVLQHTPSPVRVLAGAAALADALIVTQQIGADDPDEADPSRAGLAIFQPVGPPQGVLVWWHLTPACLARMLQAVGLIAQTITLHTPPNMPGTRFCTIVARRALPPEE